MWIGPGRGALSVRRRPLVWREEMRTEMLESATRQKLQALGRQTAAVQAEAFLRAFCGTFTGTQRSAVFEEVLEAAAAFETALEVNTARTGVSCVDLEEDLAHQFLENHGHPLTVVEMRAAFVQLDLDQSHRMSYVEYLLWRHQRPVEGLFVEPAAEVADAVAAAMAELAAVMAAVQARLQREQELAALVQAGGFKGAKAAIELAELRRKRRTRENVMTVTAESKLKRESKKAASTPPPKHGSSSSLAHSPDPAAFAAEQARHEAAAAAQQAAIARGRERLKQRACLLQSSLRSP